MTTQALITKNLEHLEASKEDLSFKKKERGSFKNKIIAQVEIARELAMKIEDADYNKHSSNLKKVI